MVFLSLSSSLEPYSINLGLAKIIFLLKLITCIKKLKKKKISYSTYYMVHAIDCPPLTS